MHVAAILSNEVTYNVPDGYLSVTKPTVVRCEHAPCVPQKHRLPWPWPEVVLDRRFLQQKHKTIRIAYVHVYLYTVKHAHNELIARDGQFCIVISVICNINGEWSSLRCMRQFIICVFIKTMFYCMMYNHVNYLDLICNTNGIPTDITKRGLYITYDSYTEPKTEHCITCVHLLYLKKKFIRFMS